VQRLEQQIEHGEARQRELARALEDGETWNDRARAGELQRELDALAVRLVELSATWEREATLLQALDSA
jgi:hypothetical protein